MMNEFLSLMDRTAFLMQALGSSAAGVFMCYVGYLFLSSGGDPQAVARARGALFGVMVGLLILGFGTVIPRVFSQVVLEPSGGRAVAYFDSRQDCDGILRRQLVLQRQVNDAAKVNYLIAVIQAKNDFCSADNWDPRAINTNQERLDRFCAAEPTGSNPPLMGRLQVPPGLRIGLKENKVRLNHDVHRDGSNNVVVHFSELKRPTDGSGCWVYFSRYAAWRFGRLG